MFDLGADLCFPDSNQKKSLKVSKKHVEDLENKIDEINESLNPLNSFIFYSEEKNQHFCITVDASLEELKENL